MDTYFFSFFPFIALLFLKICSLAILRCTLKPDAFFSFRWSFYFFWQYVLRTSSEVFYIQMSSEVIKSWFLFSIFSFDNKFFELYYLDFRRSLEIVVCLVKRYWIHNCYIPLAIYPTRHWSPPSIHSQESLLFSPLYIIIALYLVLCCLICPFHPRKSSKAFARPCRWWITFHYNPFPTEERSQSSRLFICSYHQFRPLQLISLILYKIICKRLLCHIIIQIKTIFFTTLII